MVFEEIAVVHSIYHLPLSFCMMLYNPMNIVMQMNNAFIPHCLQYTLLDEESLDSFIHLIAVSSVVRMNEPSIIHSEDPSEGVVNSGESWCNCIGVLPKNYSYLAFHNNNNNAESKGTTAPIYL